MKISRLLLAGLLATVLVPATLTAAEKGHIDPKALELLKRMSTTLAGTKAFTYQAKSIIEVPGDTGQFFTLFTTSDVALQRPNKLTARNGGEAPAFNFYYNGATVEAFAPGTNVYSQTKAPATIDAMLPDLEDETGIRFATTPFLLSNPYRVLAGHLTSAVIVGPSVVNGVNCDHLAFRSRGVDWEIWLESNARALPRRLAVTFTDQDNRTTIVEFARWNLSPWLNEGQFVFRKPAGAKEIPFVSVLKSSGR